MRRALLAFSFFAAMILIWEILVRLEIWSPLLLPSPSHVAEYLYETLKEGTLLAAGYVTIKRLFLGYFIGLIFGFPIGMLNARFQFLEDTIGVLALGFQALPSICWIPLALLWFGQSETAMLFIVIMGSVWSIAIATDSGVRNVPPIYVRAARTLGSTGLHTWLKVILPAASPFIIQGMKQGWAFAWRSLMAAEIYVTILSGFGLGYLLHYNRELHSMEGVIGIMIIIIGIGLAINAIFFDPIERFLYRRWGVNHL
jgi:NitT/TauT family transport system permease protein